MYRDINMARWDYYNTIDYAVEEATKEATKKATIKAERSKQIEIAKEMLAANEPMEKIAKYTGLSEAELKAIRL